MTTSNTIGLCWSHHQNTANLFIDTPLGYILATLVWWLFIAVGFSSLAILNSKVMICQGHIIFFHHKLWPKMFLLDTSYSDIMVLHAIVILSTFGSYIDLTRFRRHAVIHHYNIAGFVCVES